MVTWFLLGQVGVVHRRSKIGAASNGLIIIESKIYQTRLIENCRQVSNQNQTGFELYLSTELYFALEVPIQITVNDSHGYIDFIQITQYYDDI